MYCTKQSLYAFQRCSIFKDTDKNYPSKSRKLWFSVLVLVWFGLGGLGVFCCCCDFFFCNCYIVMQLLQTWDNKGCFSEMLVNWWCQVNINWALKHNSLIASWRLWKSCNWSKTAKEGVASASSLVIFLLLSCYCLVIVFLYVPSLCHFHDCPSYSLKLSRRYIVSK